MRIVDFVHLGQPADVRVTVEKSEAGARWDIETSGAIDRAFACILVALVLIGAHLTGVESEIVRLITSAL